MYNILILGTDKCHEYEELAKSFLPSDRFQLLTEEDSRRTAAPDVTLVFSGDKNRVKYELYQYLNLHTGLRPPWGIITGIRPIKLTGELLRKSGDPVQVRNTLMSEYLVTERKAVQAIEMVLHQHQTVGVPTPHSAGVYIGIPFCPSRCAYCTFPSYQAGVAEMERYLAALIKEIRYAAAAMKKFGYYAESIYVGGGTPTALSPDQLARLYGELNEGFKTAGLKEFSLEAGRPDTITDVNMKQAMEAGVTRISINPQTMHDDTLLRIGRGHTRFQVKDAFQMARNAGIKTFNTDIIAGLPGETVAEFQTTLKQILTLAPQNITVHSLAMKRASRLTEENKNYHFEQAEAVAHMLDYCENCLRHHGYAPYYLYRQKQMAGSLENIGYCLPGTENIYNVRIMEENQTIVALGAGGISKAYDPDNNRLKRVANVSNYQIYIERLDEMILRKENDLFRRFETC